MEELSPPESPRDLPAIVVSTMWGRWWLRIPLFVAHLSLSVAAFSLTPSDYAFQLGATTGTMIVFGTPALWILLWFARTRGLVLLFCGLVLAETGITALVGLNFRTEDRVGRELQAEAAHRLQQSEAQMASFHLEQLFAMLTPGNEFHSEELPSLLERARRARAKAGELQADWKSWQKKAEQRFAALGAREAADFRRGMESESARAEQNRKLSEDYFAGIEELVRLLIDRQDRYRPTAAGLVFDRPEDADAFNRILDSLKAIEAQLSPWGGGPPVLRRRRVAR